MHTNIIKFVLLSIFLTLGFSECYSQNILKDSSSVSPKNDSIPKTEKNKILSDSLRTDNNSNKDTTATATDSTKAKKSFLSDKVRYKAKKFVKINQTDKTITLYDNAELYYQDIELKGGVIVMNYETNELHAGRIKDTAGVYSQYPKFKQGGNEVQPDSIRFNYKTKKALTWNSRTEQGEFRVKAPYSKKENDSVYFLKDARFTTAVDSINPEYYFQTKKVKFVPGKEVITGLTYMVVVDVPTPLVLPYAYFPMTDTKSAGIIIPTYNDSNDKGFSLQNFGYYFPISDNYDLMLMGDYYTNGSYGLRTESSYARRYRYRGNFNLRYENNITGERGYPNYSKGTIYNLQWSHSRDSKASPNSSFSASVNLGSSQYFSRTINQSNVGSTLNNTMSSSISYSKNFLTVPQTRMSLSATHSQNTQTSIINMTFPTAQYSVDRIYPFAKSDVAKKGMYRNINLQYSADAVNNITTTDSLFMKKQMFDDAKVGFQHSIPLSTNFKVFKYFSVNSSINYKQVFYTKTIRRNYHAEQGKVVDSIVKGFDNFRTASFSSGIGTTIYGTFKFGDTKKIQAIRHVMTPSVSYSNTPSNPEYYDTYYIDATKLNTREYTRFEGGVYGSPSNTKASSVGFSLGNTFEAKVTDKDSTKVEPKKVMLLNNLSFSTSYNIEATEMPWSPLRVSGGTNFFDNKVGVNFGATLDPYAIDNSGKRMDVFNIDNGGGLFRMTSANMTANYSFSSESFKSKDINKDQRSRNGGREDDLFGKNNINSFNERDETDKEGMKKDEEVEFFKAKIPWDMSLAYSLTYSNNNREKKITANSLMVSANTNLTKQWKVGASTGYDFVMKGVTFTQLRFDRDLLSWNASVSWVPYGPNSNWSFFIGMKSSLLKDLKYDKRNRNTR